ncbi:MAG: Wzz/FepE/Etk N-terminal domain-containing protein [bacterium]|nr:Wzz/FepE/Etk N-terminal domain-containing protein [bacterium]
MDYRKHSMPPAEQDSAAIVEATDAIDLAAYWNILVRRRLIVACCVLFGIGGGFAYLRMRSTPPFQHIAVVEVGTTMQGEPLEPLAQVVARTENAYVPAALIGSEFHEQTEQRYQVEVKNPVNSTVVQIEAYGQSKDTMTILEIEGRIVGAMIEEHKRLVGMIRTQLQDTLARAEQDLKALQEDAKFLPAKLKRIEESTKLLQQQIVDVRSLLNRAEVQRVAIISAEAQRALNNESIATALLLIDVDLQKKHEQLAAMEERLGVEFKEQRDGVEKAILDNRRAQGNQELTIGGIRFQIENLHESRITIPPTRFFRLASRSLSQVMTIAGMVGLLFGVFAAFFSEFVRRARAIRRSAGG